MRTIVGGRPQKDRGPGGGAARGIDVLLLKGAVDPEFRELLGRDWRAAAEEIGLELTESECAVLASISGDVLAGMSARMRVPKAHRPVFLGKAAAAMLVLAAGLVAASCGPPPPKPKPVKTVPAPVQNTDVNEPDSWGPAVVIIFGMVPGALGGNPLFESDDEDPQPGDEDEAAVNEPPVWNPPVPIFGVAPEWNERDHDYESEDEPR